MYYNGVGVEKNYAEAFFWYLKAAEQDDAYAQCEIAYMYYYGKGILQNKNEAVKWWRKSASNGNNSAKVQLNILLLRGETW